KPGTILCMEARDPQDPNRNALEQIYAQLRLQTDARGRALEVIRVPSPGIVTGPAAQTDDGGLTNTKDPVIKPASHLNFYVSNTRVIVPTFNTKYESEALDIIARCFPDRDVIGLPALNLIIGAGAFHCITQTLPVGDTAYASH